MCIRDSFKAAGLSKISDMTSKTTEAVPKHGNKEVCLKWALTGQCSSKCARSGAHSNYTTETNKRIHEYMDACNVPTKE